MRIRASWRRRAATHPRPSFPDLAVQRVCDVHIDEYVVRTRVEQLLALVLRRPELLEDVLGPRHIVACKHVGEGNCVVLGE